MLNFWTTWCGYCRDEMPTIQKAYAAHRNGEFLVLGIDVQEPVGRVSAFVDDLGITFPVLFDAHGKVTRQYRIRGLPTSVFIDRDGIIHSIHVGPVEADELEYYLDQLGVRQG
jgi:thiol-disulfide isomerase/thioredoxin